MPITKGPECSYPHREHHRTPMVEEVGHEFACSRYISKMDETKVFWCAVLDHESPLLITFNSPFGSYCFLQLSMGTSNRPKVFHKMINAMLYAPQGVVNIADDIQSMGLLRNNNKNLCNLMECAQRDGLLSKMCDIRAEQIMFFGCIYEKTSRYPDPAKTEAIQLMPSLTCQ